MSLFMLIDSPNPIRKYLLLFGSCPFSFCQFFLTALPKPQPVLTLFTSKVNLPCERVAQSPVVTMSRTWIE